VTDAATPRTPGIRVLQTFVFWTYNLDPAIYPGHRLGGLLPGGGIIGSDVSEHLLRYNRFEAHRSWISWLFIGFVFHKHRFQQVCIVGCVWIFERSFSGCSLVRLLPKHASTTDPRVSEEGRHTFSLASLLYLASLSNCPSTLNAGTTPALLVRCTLTTGSFSIAIRRWMGKSRTPEEFVKFCDEIDRFSTLHDCKDVCRDEIRETPALDVFRAKILQDEAELSLRVWVPYCGQVEVFEGPEPSVVVELWNRPPVFVRIAVTIVIAIGEYLHEKIVPRTIR